MERVARASGGGHRLDADRDGPGNETEFADIAIGEVWVACGRSNMEFHLEFDADRDRVLSGQMYPTVRFFDVPKVSYEGQESERDYSRFGR